MRAGDRLREESREDMTVVDTGDDRGCAEEQAERGILVRPKGMSVRGRGSRSMGIKVQAADG